MLRVGMISYINSLPLTLSGWHLHAPSKFELLLAPPKQLFSWLMSNKVDVALISTLAYLSARTSLSLLPFGIFAEQRASSVALFTKQPPHMIHDKEVAITEESESSRFLFLHLCRHLWKIAPPIKALTVTEDPLAYDRFLLIGDRCLLFSPPPSYQKIDLVSHWRALRGLPYPFALLVRRNDLSSAAMELLPLFLQEIDASLFMCKRDPTGLFEEALLRLTSSYPRYLLQSYFHELSYRLTDRHLLAINLVEQGVREETLTASLPPR